MSADAQKVIACLSWGLANCDATISVPGVAFAEYGPGDHAYWLYGLAGMQPGARPAPSSPDVAESRPEMAKVRQAVLDSCRKA
jgi:4-hydroxy-2-oxoheptanedioate aldolase